MDIWAIITVILGVAGTIFSGVFVKVKGKLSKIVKLGTEAIEVAKALEAALEDNKITKEEVEGLKKELSDVKEAWKDLVKKEK